ncbi:outer membrane family protein, partial [Helicobacter cinaedi]|uniref:outer membrane family protein n=1 Tax=Helicobacter cinaedi TaxID=213 RepID=UPI001FAF0577
MNFYKHFAGVMLYKNWGNANAWIGSYGDPFNGFDIWIGSAYDKGASLSDMIGRNAISTIGYIGG